MKDRVTEQLLVELLVGSCLVNTAGNMVQQLEDGRIYRVLEEGLVQHIKRYLINNPIITKDYEGDDDNLGVCNCDIESITLNEPSTFHVVVTTGDDCQDPQELGLKLHMNDTHIPVPQNTYEGIDIWGKWYIMEISLLTPEEISTCLNNRTSLRDIFKNVW